MCVAPSKSLLAVRWDTPFLNMIWVPPSCKLEVYTSRPRTLLRAGAPVRMMGWPSTWTARSPRTDEISAYANRAGSDESDSEDVVVGTSCLAGDQTGTFQRLNTETVLKSNNIGNLVTTFATILDLLRPDSTGELRLKLQVVFVCEVEVVKAFFWVVLIDPRCRGIGLSASSPRPMRAPEFAEKIDTGKLSRARITYCVTK